MAVKNSVLESVREAMGLSSEDESFDMELLLHINSALAIANQNAAVLPVTIEDTTQTWDELKDPEKEMTQYLFHSVKLFVFLKTKLLFDPPAPSTASYMEKASDELLWRFREELDLPNND